MNWTKLITAVNGDDGVRPPRTSLRTRTSILVSFVPEDTPQSVAINDISHPPAQGLQPADLKTLLAGVLGGVALTSPQNLRAHGDTSPRPMVATAKVAFKKKDLTPVLI